MLGNEPEERCRRHLPPFDDAERDQVGQQPGCLGLADPGKLGDGLQVGSLMAFDPLAEPLDPLEVRFPARG